MSDDPYRTVEAKIARVREKSVLIKIGPLLHEVWVPRSVLHGADDGDLDGQEGLDMRLRIREWFCKREDIE